MRIRGKFEFKRIRANSNLHPYFTLVEGNSSRLLTPVGCFPESMDSMRTGVGVGEREETAERGGGDLKPNSSPWVSKPGGVGNGHIPKSPSLISTGMACACLGGGGWFSEVLQSFGSEYPFSFGLCMRIREPLDASRQLGSRKKKGKTEVKDLIKRACFSG